MSLNNFAKVITDCQDGKTQYDENVKRILADKMIIAKILKSVTNEFKDYDEETIISCIEDDIVVGKVPVDTGYTNSQVIGMNTESAIAHEGFRRFDVLFHAHTPGHKNKRFKLIINLEAQKNPTKYAIESRAFFYVSRLISSQQEREFVGDDFDSIKKVYGIWICMNVAKDEQNTITRYYIDKEMLYGKDVDNRYDFMEIVILRLGDDFNKKTTEILEIFETIFAKTLSAGEKITRLEKDYNMQMNSDFEKEVHEMCNLSEALIESVAKDVTEEVTKEVTDSSVIAMIKSLRKYGISDEDIVNEIVTSFSLTKDDAANRVASIAK